MDIGYLLCLDGVFAGEFEDGAERSEPAAARIEGVRGGGLAFIADSSVDDGEGVGKFGHDGWSFLCEIKIKIKTGGKLMGGGVFW